MKKPLVISTFAAIVIFATVAVTKLFAAEKSSFQTYEYAMIRWSGKENTHVVRPNGQVELLGPLLTQVTRPDKADERTLLLTVAMNAVAKEGYEFAGMTPDVVVMRRPTTRQQ